MIAVAPNLNWRDVDFVALLRDALGLPLPVLVGNDVDLLLERAAAKEPSALEALSEEGRWLGVGIADLINACDPDVVVLGALFNRILPSVRPALDAELARRRIHGLDRFVPVAGAAFGRDATLMVAAELAFGPLLADPAIVAGCLT